MSEKHTPTPWKFDPSNPLWIQSGEAPNLYVALCMKQQDAANAAFIVRACNAHDALVDLAKNLIAAIEEDRSIVSNPGRVSDDASWFVEQARAALALAEARPALDPPGTVSA